MAPFSIRGGLELKEESVRANFISCLIVSNKVALLEGILLDLTLQDIPKNNFETVIVFDGPGEEIVRLVEKFKTDLDIHLDQTVSHCGLFPISGTGRWHYQRESFCFFSMMIQGFIRTIF